MTLDEMVLHCIDLQAEYIKRLTSPHEPFPERETMRARIIALKDEIRKKKRLRDGSLISRKSN